MIRMMWVILLLAMGAVPAWAQIDPVRLDVTSADLGFDGVMRAGTWTPARLTLEYQGGASRGVLCQWLLRDVDGDQVKMQRRVTLNPLRKEVVWLYAPVPVAIARKAGTTWQFQVIDAESGRLLATREIAPDTNKLLPPAVGAIGVFSNAMLGLDPYVRRDPSNLNQRFDLQHEPLDLVQGLSLETLPDRWYGLSLMHAMIWTRDGGDPNDPKVTSEMHQALRDWVRRGGHLILSVPAVKKVWPTSALADLLPVSADAMRAVQDDPPIALGAVTRGPRVPIRYTVFDVPPGGDVSILARDRQGSPFMIAKRYGFGRVTLVGVDLADRQLVSMGLPNGSQRIWNTLLGWRSPVFSTRYLHDEIKNQRMSHPRHRAGVDLMGFVPSLIAMRNTSAPALLGAIVIFALYWLVAGPLCFMGLKSRGLLRHSWLVFVGVIVVFSTVSWGGAWLLQPGRAQVAHFTLLDADARSGTVHARSWLSLYLPTFANAQVAIAPDQPQRFNTLASPGLNVQQGDATFLDAQSYTVNAGAPNTADIPYRSTAKQFQADYLGPIDRQQAGLAQPWVLPQGHLSINAMSFPQGVLTHGLPTALEDVVLVYCPGNGQMPWVKRHGSWEPKIPIDLAQVRWPMRLVQKPAQDTKDRKWTQEGFLGTAIANVKGVDVEELPEGQQPAGDKVKSWIEMFSFYDMLPPPNFRSTDVFTLVEYNRTLGRLFDLTSLTQGRRLIVLGHLQQGPLPMPLTAQGQDVATQGWTVMRWIYDF